MGFLSTSASVIEGCLARLQSGIVTSAVCSPPQAQASTQIGATTTHRRRSPVSREPSVPSSRWRNDRKPLAVCQFRDGEQHRRGISAAGLRSHSQLDVGAAPCNQGAGDMRALGASTSTILVLALVR